jgi:chromosome segregation ATPase
LNGLIENKDNEELFKLKDDLSKITNMKIEMEVNLKQMKNELKLKLEENSTLNKKIQQKDNYIITLEKKLKDMKETNEKELNQLKDELNNINHENKEMTNKIKAYDSKYLQLKANNEQMKLRIDNIQNTLMMLTQLNFPKK